MDPVIRKVGNNGQVSLPPKYRGMNMVIKESKKGLLLEPLYWDEELEVFLNQKDYEEIHGEVVWSAKEDGVEEGISPENVLTALQKTTS